MKGIKNIKYWYFLLLENQRSYAEILSQSHTFTMHPKSNVHQRRSFVWLFSIVYFQMPPQIVCSRGCKVTLVAFVWLFPTVCFQMSPHNACPRECIVTLVSFVWFFFTVHLQVSLQIACHRGCIVTLVTFAWLLSIISLCYWNIFINIVFS